VQKNQSQPTPLKAAPPIRMQPLPPVTAAPAPRKTWLVPALVLALAPLSVPAMGRASDPDETQFKTAILKRLSMKDTPIESALVHFVELGRQLNEGGGPLKWEQLQQAIINELDMYKFQVEKEALILEGTRGDIEDLRQLYTEKEVEIARVKQEIEQLKQKLNEEKQQQQNKEQYLALAKLINQHPPRAETERAITGVEEELSTAEERSKLLEREIESRSMQFQLVLHGLSLLHQEMEGSLKSDHS